MKKISKNKNSTFQSEANIIRDKKDEATTSTYSFFVKDIQMMMHGFGDVSQPLLETAKFIQKFVYEQICCYLFLANHIAEQRCSSKIGIEEIMFLFRHNISRLFHFVRHLKFRDSKGKFETSSVQFDFSIKSLDSKHMKRTKICYQFLECLDSYSSLKSQLENNDFNDIKIKKLQIAELLTRDMNLTEYDYYSVCRQASFGKQMKLFQKWFSPVIDNLFVRPNKYGWEGLAYLAHETVAEIIYLAVLTQADQHHQCDFKDHQSADFSKYFLLFNKTLKKPITSKHILELLRRCYDDIKPGNCLIKDKMLTMSQFTQPFLVLI